MKIEDRLTNRSPKNNLAYLVKVMPDEQSVESPYPNTLKAILESLQRLAAYEDTGLSPEEIEQTKEKQIPKEPYLIGQVARCGACGYELKEGDGWTCCPKCGQGIDWAALVL
jgi:predicted Zn-ribbon and HTH transcriptional regulator